MLDYKKIGKNIYVYRKSKRLTQKQLADLIDRAESTIQKYEKGDIEIPNSVLQSLANALGITYNNLVDWNIQEATNEIIAGINPTTQKVLKDLGYTLIWRSKEEFSLIDDHENAVFVTLQDIKSLEKDAAAYVKFKIRELFENAAIRNDTE